MTRVVRSLVLALAAVFVLLAVAETADAQRRRRRRRRRPPPAQVEPTPPPEEPEDEGTPGPNPFDEPAPPEADPGADPPPADDPGPTPPDLTPLRTEYEALMDDLVQARTRVHALGQELFQTRVAIRLRDQTAANQNLARIVVSLDGAPVFRSDGPVEGAASGRDLFSGALSPGPHVLSIEVEQRSRDDDAFRYTLRDSYRFQVQRERLADVELTLTDGSDIGRRFEGSGSGRYEVHTRMQVVLRPLPTP